MPSTTLLSLVVIQLLGLVVVAWTTLQIRRFILLTPKIGREDDIIQLKQIVATNMYAALATILLLGGPWAIYLVGVFTGHFDISDFSLFVLPSIAYPLLGLVSRKLEGQLAALPTATAELEQQRDRIISCWKTRPLPDWK